MTWRDDVSSAVERLPAFVESEPHFADELRAWRDATNTRASVTGLVMSSIYRALRDADITLADDCEVPVDLRRFLPDAATATFSAALVDPDTVRSALRRAFTSQNLRTAQGSPRAAVRNAVA
ncbi:hypothetical protein [Candidatus Mycobacterium methanotrophicum]|uniref:Uncharacterized protein n=1 Tax=Candidatus Mycobacterium methanotrophicum TaxID=2943498 RepID=A0ABY4QQY2_9MYCO|nr:hypothetical protein [Candidatus Mycobacterium methanotrophicum]UQX12189.1 hypothetical protein M5I08_07820 [Candidatus Mycobacterium methanotrophicum]